MSNNFSFKTTDKSIREVLKESLLKSVKDNETTIISEFKIPNGLGRVDIAVVNGVMHGYELKSDLDTLTRLEGQIYAYNKIFDNVTIVVGKKHLINVLYKIPSWWGVTLAKSNINTGKDTLHELRSAKANPNQDLFLLSQVLWKFEALDLLLSYEYDNKYKELPKVEICRLLTTKIDKEELKSKIRSRLIERKVNTFHLST